MRCLAFSVPLLLLAGCADQEPLAPAFAGEWASAKRGCSGGPRIAINKSGISASGMPIDGLTFTRSTVTGATAHLTMELSAAAKLVVQSQFSDQKSKGPNPADYEIVATLIASNSRVFPTNVIARDKKTRHVQAAPPDVLAIVTLVRCDGRTANATFREAGAAARLDRSGR
jgi:hypothetical protein